MNDRADDLVAVYYPSRDSQERTLRKLRRLPRLGSDTTRYRYFSSWGKHLAASSSYERRARYLDEVLGHWGERPSYCGYLGVERRVRAIRKLPMVHAAVRKGPSAGQETETIRGHRLARRLGNGWRQ